MTITAPTLPDARPTCADPKWLEVVDAAFKRPGGPAGQMMASIACPGCPVRVACLDFAVEHGEHGPWGGTNGYVRARLRGRVSYTRNLNGIRRSAGRAA